MARDGSSVDSHIPERDELDEIFNYDTNIDHILNGLDDGDSNANSNSNNSRGEGMRNGPGQTLGIDEEIKITKQRKPVAKLDETRQVSQRPLRPTPAYGNANKTRE